MAFEADAMAERRRLTRKLSLWRVLAIAAACVALVGVAVATFGRSITGGREPRMWRASPSAGSSPATARPCACSTA